MVSSRVPRWTRPEGIPACRVETTWQHEAGVAISEAIHLDQLEVQIPALARTAALMDRQLAHDREAVTALLACYYTASAPPVPAPSPQEEAVMTGQNVFRCSVHRGSSSPCRRRSIT